MKTKILSIIVIVASLGFYSCEDFLTVTPHDSLNSDNAMESISDYNNVMMSCYESIRNDDYTDFNTIVPDVMSDNLLLCSDGRQTWNEYFQFNFTSTTFGTAGLWLASYNAILSANEVITRMDAGKTFADKDEDAQAQGILAEALAFRAYVHFVLVRYYGSAYQIAGENGLGVPYKVSTDASEKPSRETVKSVYEKIITDLNRAKTILTSNATYNSKVNNRINLRGVNAILTKVYFTKGDYTNAEVCALAAIKKDGSDVVKLNDYTKMWTTSMEIDEVIWRISMLQTDDQILGNVYGQGDPSNHKPEYVVTQSLVQLLNPDTDIRASGVQEVTLSGKNFNAVWKFHGRTGESTGKVDMPLIRTSEMYLTLAEIKYRKSDLNGAREYLDYVRKNRYLELPSVSDSELLSAIYMERRLELAFEGDRFFEIKRLNMDIQRDNFGDQSDGSGIPAVLQFIPKTSPYFLLAIPQDEINANANMVQNNY